MIRCHSSSGQRTTRWLAAIPALHSNTSSRPRVRRRSSTMARTASPDRMSAWNRHPVHLRRSVQQGSPPPPVESNERPPRPSRANATEASTDPARGAGHQHRTRSGEEDDDGSVSGITAGDYASRQGEGKAPQAAGSVLLLHIGYGTVIFLTGGQP